MGPPVFAACRLIYDPDKGFGEELVAAVVDIDDDKASASRRLVDSSSSDGDADNSSADISTGSQGRSTITRSTITAAPSRSFPRSHGRKNAIQVAPQALP